MGGASEDGAVGRAAVLIVEDHPLTRDGVRQLLEAQPELSVCGEAGTVAEARRLAAELRPDLILLDLRLPDGDGLSVLEEVRTWADPPKVLVFSAEEDGSERAEQAMRLGAHGFVPKPTPGDGLLAAIRTAVAGQVCLPDAILQRLIRRPY